MKTWLARCAARGAGCGCLDVCGEKEKAVSAFAEEYERARAAHGPMASAHEGYAIILEELDEIKQIVWQKQKNRNYDDLRKEVVQLGAMALAFLVEIVDTENRK